MRKKIISVAITAALILSILSSTVSAAPQSNAGNYITIKKTVVGSSTSSLSMKTLSKGRNVTIILTVKNRGILWGKTWNGTWINMADLVKSDVSAGETGFYMAVKNDVPLRLSPDASVAAMDYMAQGDQIKITETFFNDAGIPWGKGVYYGKEYVVFMENLIPLSKKVDEAVYEYDGEDVEGMKIGGKPITKYYDAKKSMCVMELLTDEIYGIGDSGKYDSDHKYIINDSDFVPVAVLLREDPEKDKTVKKFLEDHKDSIELKTLLNKKEAVMNSQLDQLFSHAVKGDVIQYQRSGSQHSAIFLGACYVKDPDSNRFVPGITVIDGNWPGDYEINVHPITYEKLADCFKSSGTGIVIYHIMRQE